MIKGNQHFILPRQPLEGDDRPRNAFGYLIGFGEAYSAYYNERDKLMEQQQQQPTTDVAETTVMQCLSRLPRIRVHERTAMSRTVQRLAGEKRLNVRQDREGRWWISRRA